MAPSTPTYGQTVTDAAGNTGVAKFDPNTGKPLVPNYGDTFVDAAGRTGVAKFNPNTGAPLIAASSQPVQNVQKNQAIQNGANALTPAPQGNGLPSQMNSAYATVMDQTGKQTDVAQQNAQRLLNAQQLVFNSSLAQTNSKYAGLQQQLQSQYEKSLQVAKQNAISLNPYSQSRGAQTSANFENRITENYQAAAAELQAQADQAQQALSAGNYQAYVQIQNGLDTTLANINKETNALLLDFVKQSQQQQQFEASLESTNQRAAADDFRLGLSTINYTPEMVDKMVADGSIYKDPTFLSGVKANGIESAPGIISAMKQGSLAAQKQLDLQRYREEQLALSNARLAAAAEKQTRFQSVQMAQQGAMNTAAGSGYKPGSLEYAVAAAQGSVGGSQPTQADRDYYRDVDTLVDVAGRFRSELDKIGNNTQARNAFSTWLNNPLDDEAQTFLATQVPATYRIASIAFGQSGRGLSDADRAAAEKAIGVGAQSAAAREQIFAGWLKDAQTAMTSKLQYDALSGVYVAPFAPNVENAANTIDSLISTTNKTKAGSVTPAAQKILDQYGVKIPKK